MPKQALAAMLLLAAMTLPVGAQSGPDGGPPPPAPENPPPETKADRQKNSAAKLAGLLFFVQNACPEVKPDYERFKTVVAGLGVALDDLSKGDLLLRSRAYTEIYTKDTPASCARAVANFGETGTTIPGLVVKR
ncbi:hypothetical protein G3T14_11110 [Methylobacterium sp. BTF04]|uniref:hypothetical protein n=1 Tax=Methylobacterium sp. BTF04 TaxID=2708300 RepID=UPI0013D562DA|nr:hypothetical protein [Methylobacterium sp. BTF04]NEU12685.1 hypothetical protein [Methylobacterium sp. BTF04]